MASWIATALGLAGGGALCLALAGAILPRLVRRSQDALLMARLAFAGTLVALLPAVFLAMVVGAALGSAWGRQIGVAVGTAAVFAAVLIVGAAAGVVLAKAILWRRRSSAP